MSRSSCSITILRTLRQFSRRNHHVPGSSSTSSCPDKLVVMVINPIVAKWTRSQPWTETFETENISAQSTLAGKEVTGSGFWKNSVTSCHSRDVPRIAPGSLWHRAGVCQWVSKVGHLMQFSPATTVLFTFAVHPPGIYSTWKTQKMTEGEKNREKLLKTQGLGYANFMQTTLLLPWRTGLEEGSEKSPQHNLAHAWFWMCCMVITGTYR